MGPMKVTVEPVAFDVKIIPNRANEDSAKLNAQISYDYALIIEKHLDLQLQALALTHEAVHAILTQARYEDHGEKTAGNLPRNQHIKDGSKRPSFILGAFANKEMPGPRFEGIQAFLSNN